MKHWKANKQTSARIIELMSEWDEVLAKAKRMARRVGAKRSTVYTDVGFGRSSVSGFIFSDEADVDRSQFCRLKNTPDGWRPRRNGSKLSKEFYELESHYVADIAGLIGMKLMNGITLRRPGVRIVGDTVYLKTPDDVDAKGCRRISDITYEKAIFPNSAKR